MPGWVEGLGGWQVALLGLLLNVATVAASVAIWHVVVRQRGVEAATRAVSRRDLVLTTSTTLVNSAVLVPAWWLWRDGRIEIPGPTPVSVVLGTAYLLAGLETSMYAIHRTFHLDPLYRWFHQVHHTDDGAMSPLSLFVMHPLEPFGFALTTGVLLVLVPVPFAAIGAFFTVNLIVGTLAHVPVVEREADAARVVMLGGSRLHQAHHARPRTAYGFFTSFWDRALGTS